MTGSGSGSESGSGSGSGCDLTSTYITSTVSPTPSASLTPSPMADSDGDALMAATLAVAVLALLLAITMLVLFLIMFHFVVKLRRDVRRLHIGEGATTTKIENGSSHVAVTRLDVYNRTALSEEYEMSLDQKPPVSPTTPKTTALPQNIPRSPPPGPGYEDVETELPTETVRTTSPRDRYDNVVLIGGVLPPELRTEENLEGRPLREDEMEKLQEHERRVEEMYEDVEKRQGEASGDVTKGRDNVYTNPADAIKKETVFGVSKKGGGSGNPQNEARKKFKVVGTRSAEHEPGNYTDVFDQLPLGQREIVKQTKTGRETNPLVEMKTSGDGRGGGERKIDASGYEDIADDVFNGASSAPSQETPLSGSTGNIAAQPEGQGDQGKAELTKRYSHPAPTSRRDGRKEMVEVNPHSRKPVLLSSGRKKQQLQCQEGGGGEEGRGGGREEVDGKGENVTDGPESKSNTTATDKTPKFSISSEPVAQDSYAMVDMTSKHRYRAESDSTKKEGSGPPQHYTVKERPPEMAGQPCEVIEVKT